MTGIGVDPDSGHLGNKDDPVLNLLSPARRRYFDDASAGSPASILNIKQ